MRQLVLSGNLVAQQVQIINDQHRSARRRRSARQGANAWRRDAKRRPILSHRSHRPTVPRSVPANVSRSAPCSTRRSPGGARLEFRGARSCLAPAKPPSAAAAPKPSVFDDDGEQDGRGDDVACGVRERMHATRSAPAFRRRRLRHRDLDRHRLQLRAGVRQPAAGAGGRACPGARFVTGCDRARRAASPSCPANGGRHRHHPAGW